VIGSRLTVESCGLIWDLKLEVKATFDLGLSGGRILSGSTGGKLGMLRMAIILSV